MCPSGRYANNPFAGAVSGSTYTFNSGTFLFEGGLSLPANGITVTSAPEGVFFYVANGSVSLTAPDPTKVLTSSFQLTPLGEGPYAGISLFQDPTDTSPMTLWADTTTRDNFQGAVEAPGASVFIASNTKTLKLASLLAQSLTIGSVSQSSTNASISITS